MGAEMLAHGLVVAGFAIIIYAGMSVINCQPAPHHPLFDDELASLDH